jgi:hypothetical protein
MRITKPNAPGVALWIFALAVLARMMFLLVFRPPFETLYWDLSTSLLNNGALTLDGARSTEFEPLYPLVLAALRVLSSDEVLVVQILQTVIGAVGTIYMHRLAQALSGRAHVATVAASLYAIHPLLIRQSVAPADLTLATTLLVMFAYYFVVGSTTAGMARAGAVLGLVVLTRTMMAPLALFAAALLVVERRAQAALALAAVTAALVLPSLVRNHSVNGSWSPTRSGLNLYIGNSPYTAALLPNDDLDILEAQASDLIDAELSHISNRSPEFERAANQLLTRRAVEYMADHPVGALKQRLLNCLYFFSPWLVPFDVATAQTRAVIDLSGRVVVQNSKPRPLIEVISYTAFYAPVLAAALIGVYLRRGGLRRDAILWCIAANIVIVHALYVPATRYRAPMEFVLLFYAAVAVQVWLPKWSEQLDGLVRRICHKWPSH